MNCCRSCGSTIPRGQDVCSMCYGDPFYGRDDYYLDYLQRMQEDASREREYYDELEEELESWEAASEEDCRGLED